LSGKSKTASEERERRARPEQFGPRGFSAYNQPPPAPLSPLVAAPWPPGSFSAANPAPAALPYISGGGQNCPAP